MKTNNGLLLDLDPRQGLASASIMFRLKQCPPSLALANWIKRHGYFVPQNPAAKSGIRIHQSLAVQILAEAPDQYCDKLSESEREIAFNCAELRGWLVSQWMAERSDSLEADYSIYVERRLWYKRGDIPLFSGQADLIVLDRAGKRALILDYKTGRLEAQPAADNMQLRAEAVLLKAALPDLEEIQGVIVEPLVSWKSERVKYDAQALVQAEQEILEIVDQAAWQAKEPRHAGPWCAYCPGRVYCKEAANYIQTIPGFPAANRDSLDEVGESKVQFDSEALFRDLPRGERGTEIFRRIKIAEKLLEAITQTYEAILAKEPNALPGFILPEVGRPRRQVIDPAKLKEALAELMTSEEIDGCAEYSLTQIEKHYAIKAEVSKETAKKLIGELTAEVTTVTHAKPFIRPLTKAERAAIENGTAQI